tara:strand:+ start:135 stop:749 length:615 start_codon:yes stop_codon:yes gene_type:complete
MNKLSVVPFHQRKRQLNKKHNKESLIISARQVFAQKGFENASVREIVLNAKLGSGTFYNYFEDKFDIFLIINGRLVNEFSDYFLREIEKVKTFNELVRTAFNCWFSWILNEEENYQFIKNNKKYVLDLKWLSQNSKEYRVFNKKLFEIVIQMSKTIKFPQNDISFMVTSIIAVCINLGDEMLERDDVELHDASKFAAKLFLEGL